MHALNDAILSSDIPDHERAFGGGTLGAALAFVHELFKKRLTDRKRDPFLELTVLAPNGCVDLGGVRRLFDEVAPCVVLQQGHGNENQLGRDLLWTADDHTFDLRGELAVLHCALHFLLAHLGPDCFVATSHADPSPCPFYTCCSLQLRQTSPGTCKRTPWKAFGWAGWLSGEGCSYAAAVASSAGHPRNY
jgi:hypothetical protein